MPPRPGSDLIGYGWDIRTLRSPAAIACGRTGVRGRHISYTHFYPWMAEEFGLGEHDRFSLLSGIAHDPIQRDSACASLVGRRLGARSLATADANGWRSVQNEAGSLASVFTPFFFGASIHVPQADDIGTPGRLAEWMARSGVTVTHLTPGAARTQTRGTVRLLGLT